jgi:hypothetical protein
MRLDILRFELDETMCWDALQRIMAETRPLPKEAFFLAEHLTRRATAEFQARHGAQLAGHMAQLRRVRAGGMENTYSA